MEQYINRISFREAAAFLAAGALVIAGYFLSKAFAYPTIVAAASCTTGQSDQTNGEELHVVGCSGIL